MDIFLGEGRDRRHSKQRRRGSKGIGKIKPIWKIFRSSARLKSKVLGKNRKKKSRRLSRGLFLSGHIHRPEQFLPSSALVTMVMIVVMMIID